MDLNNIHAKESQKPTKSDKNTLKQTQIDTDVFPPPNQDYFPSGRIMRSTFAPSTLHKISSANTHKLKQTHSKIS